MRILLRQRMGQEAIAHGRAVISVNKYLGGLNEY